jgi:ubiquinol-cytochrome c reductase cytochrome b subunit
VDREKIRFGSRDWIRSVLLDFSNHFAPLKNVAEDENARPEFREAATVILDLETEETTMAQWSRDNGAILKDPNNAPELEPIVEFLYAQSGRDDALPMDDPRVQQGRAVFADGSLSNGNSIDACANCHDLHVRGEETAEFNYGGSVDLTGYGGHEWLRKFIASPESMYKPRNAMPAFGTQLTEHELEMLVRWMVSDYYRPGQRLAPSQAGPRSE